MGYPTTVDGILGIWFALALMLMVYSYPLFRENQLFRFSEHLFIGLSLAIAAIIAIQTTIRLAITPLMAGKLYYIIPILLGFMMYLILHRDYRWLSRYPIGILVGASIGLGMRGVIIPNIISQIIATITPPRIGADAMAWLNFVYIGIGTTLAVMYFLLTFEHRGPLVYPSRLGRWIIMIGLGAYFGNTVLFRMAMLSGRAQFLLQVLGLVPF